MNYNKDFEFYLLPCGAIFSDFLSNYEKKEEVPKLTKKDFDQLVKIITKNNIMSENKMYELKDKIKSLIPEDLKVDSSLFSKKSVELVVDRLDLIYSSHLGVSLLYELCYYEHLSLSKDVGNDTLQKQVTKIMGVVNTNNCPVDEYMNEPKKNPKIKKYGGPSSKK